MYTDNIELTVQIATPILAAARKYCVDRLVKECQTFLRKNMTVDDACLVYEHAHIYMEESLKEDCLHVISQIDGEGLRSASFLELCPDCVKSITESDDLSVAECDIFEALMRWSEAECGRQGLEVTEVNRREVLGDILYTVRFPTMDDQYLTRKVAMVDMLTGEEFRSIWRCRQDENKSAVKLYSIKSRNPRKPPINGKFDCITRFSTIERYQDLPSYDDLDNAISFQCTHDLFLHGISIFKTFGVTMKLGVYRANGDPMYKECHPISVNLKPRHVLFRNVVRIKREEVVTVVVHGRPIVRTRGINGKSTVPYHHANITFLKSNNRSPNTDVNHGQIPGLLLSM